MLKIITIPIEEKTKERFDKELLNEAVDCKKELTADDFLTILLDIRDNFEEYLLS